MNRREFVVAGAAAGAGLAAPATLVAAPAVHLRRARPIIVSSANGNGSRDADGKTAVVKAFEMMTAGGDVLDACIAGVNIVELDAEDTSVGYGGLPNADGVVQLDSCCMHGPLKRAGGVAAIEGVRTPSRVAQAVAELTDHHLLVGKGASEFARQAGFTVEDDLNTPRSRAAWLEWKRRVDPEHWLDPSRRSEEGDRVGRALVREGLIDADHYWGTINCNGVNARGDVCGVTTTSGLAFKIPGRVGDSPILGAGLYVDNAVGAAGSTGRGEANLFNLCSFLIVENLRRGMSPKDAGLDACRRIAANTTPHLRTADGRPDFGITFYVMTKAGEHAGVAMYPGTRYVFCDGNGPQYADCEPLYDTQPTR